MIIGITGGSGCGKTTLLDLIRQQGGLVLDCDAIYHDLLQGSKPLLLSIEARFPGVVTETGLDRKKLGRIVFSDEKALKDLNRITHSAVKEVVLARLETKPMLAAIDAIGLFEGGLAELCDVTVAITATDENRIVRLMARENVTEEYARLRIAAQKSNEEFAAPCDYMLENNDTAAQFTAKCFAFLQTLGIMKENN
jgi:dephospho-CoA kinase